MRKRLFIAGAAVSGIVLLAVSPVEALSLGGIFGGVSSVARGFLLDETGEDIGPYLDQVQQTVSAVRSKNLGNIFKVLTTATGSEPWDESGAQAAIGQLGLPIPEELGKIVSAQVDKQEAAAGTLSNPTHPTITTEGEAAPLPVFRKQTLGAATSVSATEATLDTLLGADGQQQIATQMEGNAKLATLATTEGEAAQKATATQDVQKHQANQLKAIANMDKAQLDEAMQLRIAQYQRNQIATQERKAQIQKDWEEEVRYNATAAQAHLDGSAVAGFFAPVATTSNSKQPQPLVINSFLDR